MRLPLPLLLLAAAPGFAAGLPAFFISISGEVSEGIRFFVQTPELRAGFSAGAAIFQMRGLALRVGFAGANPDAAIEGEDRLTAQANFFKGHSPEGWSTERPLYSKILYRDLYPGIDLSYSGAGSRIKSEFTIAPGGDPGLIRLEYSGVGDLGIEIDSNGDLLVRGEHLEMREQAPLVYQESAGGRVEIASRYAIYEGNTVGFEIGSYDPELPLVIDPLLSYATYLGGSGLGAVTGVAVDSAGDLYVTGWTEAVDFSVVGPVTSPKSGASNGGGVDVFIAKLNAAGNALVYATYIGGSSDDHAAGIAVDSSGQAYVTGSTASTDFPLVSSIRSTLGGGRSAFALKLNAAGNGLVYSTYLGGTNWDTGTAVAADSSGNAYFAGDTQSADFPVVHALQAALAGATDSFVTKLTPAGAISFSTFLGGASDEHAGGIAVDSASNIYVAGGTASANFPVVSAVQAASGGSQDAFLAKINSSGSALVYSTYLGGSGGAAGSPEQANAVAVDASGAAYVAGVTNSSNFPVTAGAFQPAFTGLQDAFVAKMNPAGSALVYSTYLGGSTFNFANGVAVDSSGDAYVAGYTSSVDFPTVAPIQTGFNGLSDAFVSELNPLGSALVFSSYYGGGGSDQANAIAVDPNGNMFAGGQTGSLDLPLLGALQLSNRGGSTGWIARIGVTVPVSAPVLTQPANGATGVSATAALSWNAASGATSYDVYFGASPTPTFVTNTTATSFTPGALVPGGTYYWQIVARNSGGSSASALWSFTTAPAVVSIAPAGVTPGAGSGAAQTFTLTFTDSNGFADLAVLDVLINDYLDGQNACYLALVPASASSGYVYLVDDGGDGGYAGGSPLLVPSGGSIQNSQCAIQGSGSSISASGNTLTLTLFLTFTTRFAGDKIFYTAARSNTRNSGWLALATWNVPGPASIGPAVGGMTPGRSTTNGQTYAFSFTDTNGYADLAVLDVLTNSFLDGISACYLAYVPTSAATGSLYLLDDAGDGHYVAGSPLALSSGGTLQNSQCTINTAASSAVASGGTLTLNLALTFSSSFAGDQVFYLAARNNSGGNSGWQAAGSVTVP